MNFCPCCGNPRRQTAVDCTYDGPSRGEPQATCQVPVYLNHDPHRCQPCGKDAVLIDALFPVYWQGNRCEDHRDWPTAEESFDPEI